MGTRSIARSVGPVRSAPDHAPLHPRLQLGSILHAVVSQQLMLRRDRPGLWLAVEFLIVNPAVRNLIRDGKTFQIQSVLQTGVAAGMITMESSLKGACDRGIIGSEDALEHAFDPREMARLLGRQN